MKFDPLGDGKSLLEVVDCMGQDSSVVRSARVSFNNDDGEWDEQKDPKLISYLGRHEHYTPFESCVITFNVQCPIFVARQWHRHRTSSYNEVSARYSEIELGYHVPEKWRKQSANNKQGSSDDSFTSFEEDTIRGLYAEVSEQCYDAYKYFLDLGVAKEQARMILPQSMYTRFYATSNLRNWYHFYRLRADSHAQYEIRVYAEAIGKVLSELYPHSWKALIDED